MTDALEFKIDWSSKSKLRGPAERSIGELVRQLRDRLAPKAQGISITYLDDRAMRKLNREHRGINKTTDVLSFPLNPGKGEYQHLGDLVISLPTADKQAEKLGVSRRREVETLVIHGFLHLCGYDHEQDQGEMLALQAELERILLQEEPLPMTLRRGRKPGSKIKVMKDGTRMVVTGRAAKAIERKEVKEKTKEKEKPEPKPRSRKTAQGAPEAPKRKPGRPPKAAPAPEAPAPRKAPRKKKPVRVRSGVIA